MSTTTRPVTAEELFHMPDDGVRRELIAGEIREMSPAGFEHGVIVMRLAFRIARHVEEQNLGKVLAAETGFVLSRDPDTVRAPDVAYVRKERIPAEGIPKSFFSGAPDLAVEVVSPDDRLNELDDKVADWLSHGTAMVWLVNPKWRSVTVYQSASNIRTLTESQELDGGDILPGFRCRVAEIFPVQRASSE